MCNCIEQVNKGLKHAGTNTVIKQPLLLDQKAMRIRKARAQVVTEKENTRLHKKALPVFASFCPFCGESYKQGGAEG